MFACSSLWMCFIYFFKSLHMGNPPGEINFYILKMRRAENFIPLRFEGKEKHHSTYWSWQLHLLPGNAREEGKSSRTLWPGNRRGNRDCPSCLDFNFLRHNHELNFSSNKCCSTALISLSLCLIFLYHWRPTLWLRSPTMASKYSAWFAFPIRKLFSKKCMWQQKTPNSVLTVTHSSTFQAI